MTIGLLVLGHQEVNVTARLFFAVTFGDLVYLKVLEVFFP